MGNDQNQAAEVMEQQFENIVSVDDGKMFTTSLLVAEAFFVLWGGIANHTLKAQRW